MAEASVDPSPAVKTYISYSHEDKALVDRLMEHLRHLESTGLIRIFSDALIETGEAWPDRLAEELQQAEIILFLLSASFLASPWFLRESEIALKRQETEGIRIVPVILRSCLWSETPLARFQSLPRSGKPVDQSRRRADAYQEIASAVEALALKFRSDPVNTLEVSQPPVTEKPESPPIREDRRLDAGREIAEQDLRMLPELLFRIAARLRERPEMLQSLDATAFWAAVRKVQPSASTIDDLRSVNDQLRGELAPGALWAAWMLNTRATELKALLLQHPGAIAPA
jgi:hypothetical protein